MNPSKLRELLQSLISSFYSLGCILVFIILCKIGELFLPVNTNIREIYSLIVLAGVMTLYIRLMNWHGEIWRILKMWTWKRLIIILKRRQRYYL